MADNCLQSDVKPARKRRMANGIPPEECKPGLRVRYSPSPGHWFRGRIRAEPYQLASGVWVVHLEDMEPAYNAYVRKPEHKAQSVYSAALTHVVRDTEPIEEGPVSKGGQSSGPVPPRPPAPQGSGGDAAADWLDQLAVEIRAINEANGWNVTQPKDWEETYKVPAILGLIHSEVSEALEAFRRDDCDEFCEELADVVIRVLDCVAAFHDDFHSVVLDKLEKNRHRGHRHGGKRV